jgi:hypothetical protein
VQNETAIGLHRPAVMYRGRLEGADVEGDADLLEQAVQIHFDRPVHYHAQRALVGVFANERQGLGKMRIDHVGHGDQEVPGEIDFLHGNVIVKPGYPLHN